MSLDIVGPGPLIRVAVRDDIARARRAAHELAIAGGVDGRRMSELALMITVVATNLVLHGGGRLSLRELGTLGGPGLEILAFLDEGPRPWQSQRRQPAAEAFGAGLSAVRRLSDEHELALGADGSAILWARVGRTSRPDPSSLYVTGLVTAGPDGSSAAGWKAVRRHGRVTVVACHADAPDAEDLARTVVALPVRSTPAATLAALPPAVRASGGASVVELDLRHRTATAAATGSLAVRITADGHRTGISPATTTQREVRVRWAHTLEMIVLPESVSADGHGADRPDAPPPDHPGLRAASLLRDRLTPAEPGLVVVARVDADPSRATAARAQG